jgi:hypothetical protein
MIFAYGSYGCAYCDRDSSPRLMIFPYGSQRDICDGSPVRRVRLCRQDLSLRQLETLRSERLNSDTLRNLASTVAMGTECYDNRPIRYAAELAGLAGYAITQLSRAGLELDAINLPGFPLIILRRDAYARDILALCISAARDSVSQDRLTVKPAALQSATTCRLYSVCL